MAPFSGSGIFTPIVTFQPGTPATAEDQNTNDEDIADGLSQCLLRSGEGVASGELNMGGFKIVGLGAGSDPSDAVNYSQLLAFVPIGVVLDYAGIAAPTNWLICDGSAISRTTYAALFSTIGTNFGIGDGSTTFNIPDCRGRVTAGVDSTGTRLTGATVSPNGLTPGAVGGTETHALSIAELASHSHTANVTDPQHTHSYSINQSLAAAAGGAVPASATPGANTTASSTGITVAITSTGSGTAHINVQPVILMQKIIKVQ